MSPDGIPISRALLVRPGIAHDDLREAIDTINQVHGDGRLPTISIALAKFEAQVSQAADGRFSYQEFPGNAPVPISITLRASAPNRTFVFVHEVGHFIDLAGLPGNEFASMALDIEAMDDWRAAVLASAAFRTLETIGKAQAEHEGAAVLTLRRFDELWARSYAQFIAVRSGNSALRRGLAVARQRWATGVYYPRQWEDDDFVAIDRSIERLFRRLGWMTASSPRRPNGRSKT